MATTNDAVKVKECSEELLSCLGKHFPSDPGMAYTTMIFLLVKITSTLDVDPDLVVNTLAQAFQTQKLLEAEVGNEWLN